MDIGQLAVVLEQSPAKAAAGKPKSWRDRISDANDALAVKSLLGQIRAAVKAGKLTPDQAEALADLVDERMAALGIGREPEVEAVDA
jgi:hypothetical protein